MYKMLSAVSAIGLSCLIGSAAVAQTAPEVTPEVAPVTAPAPEAAVPVPTPAPAFVPNGTPIVIEITDYITTKTIRVNDTFNLRLAEPVMLNGAVVIPAGTPGKGVVIDAAKPGMAGKPGKLVLAVRYLEFEGKQIPIRGLRLGMGAKDRSGTSAVAAATVGLIGLAVTGGQMEVPAGTRAEAKLGADFVPAAIAEPASAPQSEPQTETQAEAAVPAPVPTETPAAEPQPAPQANP